MGFPWRTILNVASSVAGVAAPIAKASGIPIVSQVASAIIGIENALGSGTGETKKKAVLEIAMSALCAAEGITRQDLMNNEKAMDALDGLIEHIVDFHNAINWKK
jgi:hypothetical protein